MIFETIKIKKIKFENRGWGLTVTVRKIKNKKLSVNQKYLKTKKKLTTKGKG